MPTFLCASSLASFSPPLRLLRLPLVSVARPSNDLQYSNSLLIRTPRHLGSLPAKAHPKHLIFRHPPRLRESVATPDIPRRDRGLLHGGRQARSVRYLFYIATDVKPFELARECDGAGVVVPRSK